MIGLDTNVLVRYMANDDPVQSALAADLIEWRLTPEEPGFVSMVVMVETVWVLRGRYRWVGPELAAMIEMILAAETLLIEHARPVAEATEALKRGLASFEDALIDAIAREAGCSYTATFDRKALRLPGFAPV